MESPKNEFPHNPHLFNDHDASETNKFRFEPPLFIQRYDYVAEILKTHNCTTYIDLGCAECKLLRYVKNTNQNLNLIVGVDVDKEVLLRGNENLTSSWFDYIQTRENPLEIYLVKTDISNPSNYFIDQACHASTELDCVSMVELIEHMYPDVLEKSMETVFGRLEPKLVVITTPNSDFNVVFDDMESKDADQKRPKFRHWDHKFEWTRKEFQDWCWTLMRRYTRYELVKFDGLGEAPPGYTDIGMCSQIAVFRKKWADKEVNGVGAKFRAHLTLKKKLNYMNRERRIIAEERLQCDPFFDRDLLSKGDIDPYTVCIQYPFEMIEFEDDQQRNKALFEEMDYLINFLANPYLKGDKYNTVSKYTDGGSQSESEFEEEERERVENGLSVCEEEVALCSVEKLFSFACIEKFKIPKAELIALMKANGYEITKSEKYVVFRDFEDTNSSCWRERDSKDENGDNHDISGEGISPNSWNENENWDDDIEESDRSVQRVYSPCEQFADDENDENCGVGVGSEQAVFDTSLNGKLTDYSEVTESSFSSLEVLSSIDSLMDSNETNYYAKEVRELEVRFRAISKSLRRAERQKWKKELKGNERSNEDINQFSSD